MGEINIPRSERDALKAVDTNLLDKLIEQCVADECPGALQQLRLEACGPYVASEFRTFKRVLTEHGNAKAPKKREETEYNVRRAGDDLAHSISQMKSRLETEEKEDQLFFVDDQLIEPSYFGERLTVRVGYRWRRALTDGWEIGSITFIHNACSSLSYVMPATQRKPSTAKLKQELQDKLRDEWRHLMSLGLQAVRQYFRNGCDGSEIPETFHVSAERGLNNYSADFWAIPS